MSTDTKIRAYHYTNDEAYRSMSRKGIDGFITFGFDDFRGIIPRKRFVRLTYASKGLPNEAYDGIFEGLLEPEPRSWTHNPKFPTLWHYLFHDICRTKRVVLLSFELDKKDKAYIVDRGIIEDQLYSKARGNGEPTKEMMCKAYKRYWKSRIPVYDYKGGYELPQLAIWSGIEFERLHIEWVKPTEQIWEKVKSNIPLHDYS